MDFMSKICKFLQITPREIWNKTERMTETMDCPTCNGRGSVSSDAIGEWIDVECPRCKGTGKVTAKITIEWDFHDRKE